MKILYYKWTSFMNEGVENALIRLNISYDTFIFQLEDWEHDDEFVERLTTKLKSCSYDCVFSINYVPLISSVCESLGIRYVAWVYDSPIHIRDLSSLKNTCNDIYFFDRGQAEGYKKIGIKAKHMPLAVDTAYWDRQIKTGQNSLDHMDISFVGQLYRTDYKYFISPMDEYVRGYIEGIISTQKKLYGGYIIPELVTSELLDKMNHQYDKITSDDFQMGKRELEYMLASETTFRERYEVLALLANHYKVDWFSGDDTEISNVTKHTYADYNTQMPVIFNKSKINLNISLKAIRTGIPMRALDIMGCGGFLLSNYQVELADYFIPDRECVLYDSLEDMYEKCSYYLFHDEYREAIAKAGYEKVKNEFTFLNRLKIMLG